MRKCGLVAVKPPLFSSEYSCSSKPGYVDDYDILVASIRERGTQYVESCQDKNFRLGVIQKPRGQDFDLF